MSDLLSAMTTSASGMTTQSTRIRMVSENIANADTPGYRRKLVSFKTELDQVSGANTIGIDRVFLDRSELRRSYEPGNPLSDNDGFIQTSNVNMISEIADAREARRSYEANLKVFDQTRGMASSLLDILRR